MKQPNDNEVGAVTLVNPPPGPLPGAVIRTNSAGKVIGTRQYFSGSLSAREVKDALRRAGKTGKELTKAVNQTLRGEKDLRNQLGAAYLQASFQEGFVMDMSNVNKNQTKMTIVLVKPTDKIRITEEHIKAMSDEERKDLLALLGVK